MRKSGYDKFPFVAVPGGFRECSVGWDKIAEELQRAITKARAEKPILVVECGPGVDELAVQNELESRFKPTLTIRATDAYHTPEKIDALIKPFLHSDEALLRFNPNHSRALSLVNFFDAEALWRFRRTIDELKGGLVLIVGCGASLIAWGHLLIHADLAPRKARQRLHRNETGNLGADNQSAPTTLKNNRASSIDWPMANRWKRPLIPRWDYVLDTNNPGEPKLADAGDVRRGLQVTAKRPFRILPSFDPSEESKNSERSLDCILEESSLLLGFDDLRIEVPAVDLLFYQPTVLLGQTVYARFGHEFPTRFNSLDTTSVVSEPLSHGDGWREECMGSDGRGLVDMRRHWFSKTVEHDTHGSINVLKLIEGEEAIIESPGRAFEPFIVHFAETFIVPGAVGRYNIRPHGSSAGTEIATVKASVRIRDFSNRLP